MQSNELCKRLNEESHKYATIPESKRYTAHFDYDDLVGRLIKLKKEKETQEQRSEMISMQKSLNKKEKSSENLSAERKITFSRSMIKIDLKKLKDSPVSTKLRSKKKLLTSVNTDRVLRSEKEKILPLIQTSRSKKNIKLVQSTKNQPSHKISKIASDYKVRVTQINRKSSIV